MQPCIQGKSIDDIQAAFYVTIDGVFYEVENIVTAVDICFKMFQNSNLKYLVEAYSTWLFIQHQFLNIYFASNKVSSDLISMLNAMSDV